jgi:hypothetical protein
MNNSVCHEAKSPFKQHLDVKFTPKSQEKQPLLKPVDLSDKFGMELIINANEKDFELIQKLDMQDVKDIDARELTKFDPYIISFLLNNSKVTSYIICRFHSMHINVYAKGNNEPTHVVEDSKYTSTQKNCAKPMLKVVQALARARYTFQKHKAATQDGSVPKTKKITISSVSNVNEGQLNPNLA